MALYYSGSNNHRIFLISAPFLESENYPDSSTHSPRSLTQEITRTIMRWTTAVILLPSHGIFFTLIKSLMKQGMPLENFLTFINYAWGRKPIAWPHLGHMDALLYSGREQMKSSVFGYPNTRSGISKHVCLKINVLLPSMINHCLQLAFTFTLQLMRFTFKEQFVNIAKQCGQFFLDCTWDLLGKLQLFFKSSHSVRAIFEFMRLPDW